jgi:uncharacterized repeat protein (TIGR01451 family)
MIYRRSLSRVLTLLGLVLVVVVLTMAMLTFVQAKGSAASITVAKWADPTVVRVGDIVDYIIAVDNDGDSDLTDVIVDDDLVGCTLVGPSGDDGNQILEPEEMWTYSCSVTATGGDIVNTATVSATDALSETVTASAQATVDVIDPRIYVQKQADPLAVRVGDTVDYTIIVDNGGDVDLTDVVVDDNLAGCTLSGPAGDDGNLILEWDETWTYSCSVTAGTEDIVNTATVTATEETGGSVTGSAQVTVDVVHPGVEIAKTPDTQTVDSGSTVNFTITITNTGDDPLKDVTVLDARAPDCDNTFATLPARQGRSYSCAIANVTDGFINSARVAGTPRAGADVTDVDAAKVRLEDALTCPNDMLAYWKLDETGGSTYDDFHYGYDGECAGTCPAPAAGQVNGGQAFDGSSSGIDVSVVPGDDSFDWGAQDSFSIEFWLQTDSASTCAGNQVVVGRDDSSTSLHWWIGCRNGGGANFRLTDVDGNSAGVRGDTDLTDGVWHHVVAVRDASAGEIRIYIDGTQEDSESVTYSAGFGSTTAALNVGWLNLHPYYHFDGTLDELAVYDRALSPDEVGQHYDEGLAGRWYCQDIAIDKTADPQGMVLLGDPVTYAYAVTNPGDEPLSDVHVSDDKCSPVSEPEGDDDHDNQLDLSETWIYTCSMSLVTDTINIATVTGFHPLGGTVSHTDTVSMRVTEDRYFYLPLILILEEVGPR